MRVVLCHFREKYPAMYKGLITKMEVIREIAEARVGLGTVNRDRSFVLSLLIFSKSHPAAVTQWRA